MKLDLLREVGDLFRDKFAFIIHLKVLLISSWIFEKIVGGSSETLSSFLGLRRHSKKLTPFKNALQKTKILPTPAALIFKPHE